MARRTNPLNAMDDMDVDEEEDESEGDDQDEPDEPEEPSSSRAEDGTKKRAGPVPPPPKYDGDLRKDPRGLKKYRYQIKIWQLRTKYLLTGAEQALSLLSGLEGDAAEEFLDLEPEQFFVEDGVEKILRILEPDYEEKQITKIRQILKEHGSVVKQAGENMQQYINRYKRAIKRLSTIGVKRELDEVEAF